MYEGKKIESPLARRAKVWIAASKFENVCEQMRLEIWYAYDITLNCIWSLRAKSVSQYAILDGYHHSWYFCDFLEAFKQTHKVRPKTPRDLKESFWTTFTHFQQKAEKRVCVSENILTSISVTSNSVSFVKLRQ